MAFDSLPGLLSGAAVVVVAVLFFLLLFEPGLPYRFTPPRHPIDSREFVNFLSAIVNARLFSAGDVRVLNSGASIYEAELAAIRGAQRSVHLEAYLFLRGKIAREVLAALIERARAGVAVRLVVDRIGSLATPNRYFSELRAAGGKVYWYQPIAWYTQTLPPAARSSEKYRLGVARLPMRSTTSRTATPARARSIRAARTSRAIFPRRNR